MKKFTKLLVASMLAISLLVADCGSKDAADNGEKLTGEIKIDGSSTVYPITAAVAEEFQKTYPDVNITVGISGTGGGFKKFTKGETDISDASRPIKDKEKAAAKENKIEYIENLGTR